MRLHFSIGGYDYRRTTRFRQGINFSIIQVLFADYMHRRSGVDNKFSFLRFKSWCRQAPIFRRWEECCFVFPLLTWIHFWPASTLLRGHLALATLYFPETDPQFLERWGYADEVHLGKPFRAKDFCLECHAWRTTAFVNFKHRIGCSSVMSELFRKNRWTLRRASCLEIHNPIAVRWMIDVQ